MKYNKNYVLRKSISTGVPKPTEGIEGDLKICHVSGKYSLYAKTKTNWKLVSNLYDTDSLGNISINELSVPLNGIIEVNKNKFEISSKSGIAKSKVNRLILNENTNITGSLKLDTIAAAGSDTDKFLVSDSNIVKYRTGDQLLSDLGITANEIIDWTTDQGSTNIHKANFDEIELADDKKIAFGDNNDFTIQHNGNNSFIKDQGTGQFYLQTNGDRIIAWDSANTQNLARFNTAGSVDLYYNGNKKLDTTNTGVNITGTLEFDSLSDGSITITDFVDEDNMSSNSDVKIPTQQSVKAYVDNELAGLVDSAPAALDTLNELAAALGDDANFATTVTNSIATKVGLTGNETVAGVKTFSSALDLTGVSTDPGNDDTVRIGATNAYDTEILQIFSNDGYVRIGPYNTSWSHFVTDRARYYFNKEITIDTGIVSSYNEDLILRRTYDDSTYNQITIGDDSFEIKLDNTSRFNIDGSGNVGIGNTSPNHLLHVGDDAAATFTTNPDKAIQLSTTTNDHEIAYILYAGEGTNNIRSKYYVDDDTKYVGWDSTHSTGWLGYEWKVAGTQKMKLSTSGGLTLTHGGWNGMVINNSANANGSHLELKNTTTRFQLAVRSSGFDIRDVNDSDTSRFFINSSGNITTGVWNATAITHDYIGADAIDGDNIADDSINSEHYVDGSIDNQHIAGTTIAFDKIATAAYQTHGQMTSPGFANNDTTFLTAKAIKTYIESYGYITATLTDEQIQDKVGAMFSGNTETGITATYVDGDNNIDLVVDDTTKLPLAGGDLTGHLQITATDGSHSGSGAYVPSGTDWQNVLRLGSTGDNGINFLVNDGGTNKVSYYTNRWGSQHEWARGSENTGDGNTYQPMMRLTSADSTSALYLYDGTSNTTNIRLSAEGSNDTYFNNSDCDVAIGSTSAGGYKLKVTGTTHITGALTVDSTVDGRDLQTDGTKLDGIEASATADQTAGEILTLIEDGVDSVHYKDGSIDTAHIADDQVTYAKIQNVSATDRILGRDSAGAGVIEEITPANLRTMLNVADGATANAGDITRVQLQADVAYSGSDVATTNSGDADFKLSGTGGITTARTSTAGEIQIAWAQPASILATDIKIGEDDETKIDFETEDEIHFYAANAEQVYVADGILGPQTDSDVDLGTSGARFKIAYIDNIVATTLVQTPDLYSSSGTKVADLANDDITFADDVSVANGTLTFGNLSDGSITATAFVDEDDMSSNSATLIPTQQSVKAYVDSYFYDVKIHQWYAADANQDYIPFGGSQAESNSTADSLNDDTLFIAPYDGTLEKIVLQAAPGSLTVGGAGNTRIQLRVNGSLLTYVQEAVANETSVTFTWSANNSFSAGDRLRLSFDPTNTPKYVTATSVWKYTI